MKNIVITGATSGFGFLIAHQFLKNGHHVIATGRNLTKRTDIFKNLRAEYSSQITELDLDVTLERERKNLVQYLQKNNLHVDVLVNNAGYGLFGPVEETSDAEIRDQMEVNFFGTVFLTRDLLPFVRMRKGKIFNVSSVFGFTGFPLTSFYCASKFAMEGFSESLKYEMSPYGVQVCLIEPGGYRTGFRNNGRWVTALNNNNSVYYRLSQGYYRFMEKMATRPNFQNPVDVARGVFELSEKNDLPVRATFGRDALLVKITRKLLPGNLFHQMTQKMYLKVFSKGYQS